MNTESVMKFIGGIFIVIAIIMFFEFVWISSGDYQVDLGFIGFIIIEFILYYLWIIPLGYFVFRKKDSIIKSKEVKG